MKTPASPLTKVQIRPFKEGPDANSDSNSERDGHPQRPWEAVEKAISLRRRYGSISQKSTDESSRVRSADAPIRPSQWNVPTP
jgi:hypothetical protein